MSAGGFPWGAAIGAGASLIGSGLSFLGGQSANAANTAFAYQQLAQQQQDFQKQYDFQVASAQNGIQWRVADAQAAGISPLVALGAPTFNPGVIQAPSGGGPGAVNSLAGAGEGLSRMGQDVSRAAMAAQVEQIRADTLMKVEQMRNSSALTASQVESNMADAALARKRAELMGMPAMPTAAGGPGFMPGQGSATKLEASKQISSAPGDPGSEAAATPAYKWVSNGAGGVRMQPSLGTSAGATGEDMGWSLNYRVPQIFGANQPPPAALPEGHVWKFNIWDGHWYARPADTPGRTFGFPDAMPDNRSWYSGGTNQPPY